MNIHIVFASLSFPIWIRLTHYINLLFIGLLIRSGIQITGAHPRLYWNDGCNPEKAWLNLVRKKVPTDRLYTSMDDEVAVPTWLALSGRDTLAWVATGTSSRSSSGEGQ